MKPSMLVVYTTRLEDCREFYTGIGLELRPEKHGAGPRHFAGGQIPGSNQAYIFVTTRTGALSNFWSPDAS